MTGKIRLLSQFFTAVALDFEKQLNCKEYFLYLTLRDFLLSKLQ